MSRPVATAPRSAAHGAAAAHRSHSPNLLALAALGVVFGDIGTSPLYAMHAIFTGDHPVRATPADVYGVISLVAWSLTLMVSIKFVVFVMRADNDGEGGVMALYALVRRATIERPVVKAALLTAGIVGVALFFADAMITPAISVLSAVEGVEVAAPGLSSVVLPCTIGVLALLFAIQRHGTATIGRLFAPVIGVWFAALAAAGLAQLFRDPAALRGLSPSYAVQFFGAHPTTAFLSLGAVVLVFTGSEALYADMGHFGRLAISRAWFFVAFPALMLNYLGQASLILDTPAAISNPFYLLLPEWSRGPMIVLATCATLIASQAVIAGAFSVTRQVVQLGFLPRMTIRHTSPETIGQVYLPAVNWTLFALVVGLCLGFGSSGKLATAYGIAVTGTLLVDSLLFLVVARKLWRKPRSAIALGVVGFVLLDLLFLGANLPKIAEGGWFPMLVGALILMLLTTWHRGRELVSAERARAEGDLPDFIDEMHRKGLPTRIKGSAVFLSPSKETTPLALRVAQKRLRAIPEEVVVLTVETANEPFVAAEARAELDHLGDPEDGFSHLSLRFGYQEDPDVPRGINVARDKGLVDLNPYHVTYYLSQMDLLPFGDRGMARRRKDLFMAMARNAASPVAYFNLPPEHVVALGGQIRF
ncbi:MAG TPA: KUP/HAK/KT family potassium transporter [Solirubrobacterales bacterium]|nr:KUP/HAK/KT family potassium transporter [Solirubrobacterales bacterium]